MDSAQLWNDVLNLTLNTKTVTTLKGKAEAEVIEVNQQSITLMLEKGKSITLKKTDFEKALNILNEKGKVRQKFMGRPEIERYILGVMRMLPDFDITEDYDVGESKKKKFIKYTKDI